MGTPASCATKEVLVVVAAVPEGKYADVADDITMHYHDTGEPSRGTVMFMHGSGPGASGWSNFKGNYPFFNERGYRTLVPDTLGYGYSSKPAEGTYSLSQVAAQYRGVLDKEDVERTSLIGNSQGGAIAIQFALDFPERVDKLVLMAPGAIEERDTYMAMEGIKAMMRTLFKEGLSRETLKSLFKLQLHDESHITDDIIEERYQVAVTQRKDNIARIAVNNLEHDLNKIQAPVLCMWGVNDKFLPVSGALKVAERCANSRTMLISECGHWVMVEHQKLFNETVARFLDGELG